MINVKATQPAAAENQGLDNVKAHYWVLSARTL